MQVDEGIFRIDRVEGNVYLVVSDQGLLLVDTGIPGSAGRICRFIEAMGRDPRELGDIVLTHFHADHVGSAAALRARTGARVAIHELDAPVLTGEQAPESRMLLVRVLYALLVRRMQPDRLLRDGDTIAGLRVVHIPGHTPGSIALVSEDGVVFSGDALLTDKHGTVIPPDPKLAEDPDQALASAGAIQALHPRLLLPGHGAPARAADRPVVPQLATPSSDRRRRREVRRFNRLLNRSGAALADRFGSADAGPSRREMVEEFRRLLPLVPDVGGRENPMSSSLSGAPMALAVYRVVRAHGGDAQDAGELLHRYVRAEFGRFPGVVRRRMGRHAFSRQFRRQKEKGALRSQARRYPADWVFEMVDGDGEPFDYGYDITECGIVKYLHAHDADDLTPYLCDLDHVQAELLGYQLHRTKTLAWGCDRCDSRYSRNGRSVAPWPPEFAERTCGRPSTSPPVGEASDAMA